MAAFDQQERGRARVGKLLVAVDQARFESSATLALALTTTHVAQQTHINPKKPFTRTMPTCIFARTMSRHPHALGRPIACIDPLPPFEGSRGHVVPGLCTRVPFFPSTGFTGATW